MCVPLTGTTCPQMEADLAAATAGGADGVELRLDYLHEWDEAAVRHLLEAAARFPGEVIATYRTAAEGGHCDESEATRVSRLEFVGLTEAVDYLDVEYETWRASANIRQKIGLVCDVDAAETGRPRRRLILSKHNFENTPFDLESTLSVLAREPAHVVKVACKANSVVDALRVLDALRTSAAIRPTIGLAMGEVGLMTRVLARKLGAFLTFASLDAGKESAPGQATLDDMRRLYRWDAIGPATQVYGVIGCPVAHSMSPAILNAAFGETAHDAVYLPFRVEPNYAAFAAFVDGCVARPWLGLRGCSVTIPHKQNLLRYVEQRGGVVEPLARRIGAANTLCIEPGGRDDGTDTRVSAYNTDYRGAMDALLAGLGRCGTGSPPVNSDRNDVGLRRDSAWRTGPTKLDGVSVAVLGAGGVSRAIVAGLRDCGCAVTIYNRTRERAEALAAEFGAEARPNDERAGHRADVVINCTSIGMWPNVDDAPLPAEGLAHKPLVFDTVYNPIETRLLREARDRGCPTVDGVAMFVGQAAAQFTLWTHRPAPTDLMREVLARRLASR
ncbi:MAG: type I 3-dehydroquinate dehydratase [Planctomycetes bacterium]|nr:type I 3-dehydroquinate dehydratase [Planctomycetota bacterium]